MFGSIISSASGKRRRRWHKMNGRDDGLPEEKRFKDSPLSERTSLLSTSDLNITDPQSPLGAASFPSTISDNPTEAVLVRCHSEYQKPTIISPSLSKSVPASHSQPCTGRKSVSAMTLSEEHFRDSENVSQQSSKSSSNGTSNDVAIQSSSTDVLVANLERWRSVRNQDQWDTEMIAYLAASRLCREEAIACSLLTDDTSEWWWPSSENKKPSPKKDIILHSKSVNSKHGKLLPGGIKKFLSKQFMPFSSNVHQHHPQHNQHHLNTDSNAASRVLGVRNAAAPAKKLDSKFKDATLSIASRRFRNKENHSLLECCETKENTCSTADYNRCLEY